MRVLHDKFCITMMRSEPNDCDCGAAQVEVERARCLAWVDWVMRPPVSASAHGASIRRGIEAGEWPPGETR